MSITRTEIRETLALHLGWTAHGSWDAAQESKFTIILRKGLHWFYEPPVLPGEGKAHRWSFMRPIGSLTTVSGVGNYDLPDDFGGLIGDLSYNGSSSGPRSVSRTSVGRILELRQGLENSTGYPTLYALAPLPSDGDEGQRFHLLLDPTPDGEYEFRFQYRSNPYILSSSKPYPLGGQPHAQTLMAAVLAAAELTLDDAKGERWGDFLECLRTSVSLDRQEFGADNLGYNGDPGGRNCWPEEVQRVTYNGVLYTGS